MSSAPCRCPLCKEQFHIRPELRVKTVFSEMVSQFKQEAGSRSEVSKPGEVSCDHCSAPKLKALKSCLVCLSSYCESHLQPHLSVPGLKSHQLMEPVDNMEDRMCPQHHKPLELFCRSDHSCLCTMCALLEHQSHKFVSLKKEKASLQQQSRHMVKQRRKKIQELQSSVQLSQRAVDREKSTGLQAFSTLIESVQRSRERFIQELQEKHRHIQTQAEALIQQLKQEICELEQRSTEAEQLLRSEDHLHFLQHCPALPPTGLKDWSSVRLKLEPFEGTAARALTELEENLKETFTGEMKKVSKPKNKLLREQRFAVDLTLDTDTANVYLSVSNDLKQVHYTDQRMFLDSPQRFTYANILTKQSFSSGSFYFEVHVKDKTQWVCGVAKESVDRRYIKGLNSKYGYWCLNKESKDKYFAYTDPHTPLFLKRAPQKVGVFMDYDEGLVSFYDADTAALIYSFTDCSFTEKLFPFLNPYLEVLILIPAASRSAANRPRAAEGPGLMKPTEQHHLQTAEMRS
uniref:Uncharacterized protein n=1 Tax=Neogobius melanostomus TaxID=47308 RepID=A0A8C6THG0_9GOBI